MALKIVPTTDEEKAKAERDRVDAEMNAKLAAQRAARNAQPKQQQQQPVQPGPTQTAPQQSSNEMSDMGKAIVGAPAGLSALKDVLAGKQQQPKRKK